eukprot:TRINITY_DN65733_c0_g1_i1.p1 TRINITY_DN65733_c0_g1~~TRINITY_DN65733_c0_g1_i1.p1  ORF type:complete len:488 (+),score=183.71 TRINITY_DN65733_c0_g1_i1:69-1532(+)
MRRTAQRLMAQPPLSQACDLLPKDRSIVPHLQKSAGAEVSTLSNGFRVATKHTGEETSTVGVWIDAGSRYESWETNGVAHFLEHMTFKGTKHGEKRWTKGQISNYFEFTGGHLNAYTTREQTVYFVQVFNEEIENAMERLTAILRHPELNPAELEAERRTIMLEKQDVEMNIDEVMMDHVHLTCFPNDGLGMTILGTEQNITRNIDVAMIEDYIRNHYTARRMVMVGAGGVKHDRLVKLAESLWGDLPEYPIKPSLHAQFQGGEKVVEYDGIFPNLTIAWGICGQSAYEMLVAQVLQFYFGQFESYAEDINRESLLYKVSNSLDASAGKVQTLQAFTTPYSDVSLFGFYLASSPGTSEANDQLQRFQLDTIRHLLSAIEMMTEEGLEKAKESLKVSCMLAVDGTATGVDAFGGMMLAHGRDMPLPEFYGRVDAVSLEDVRSFVSKYIYHKPYVLTGVGHTEQLPQGGNCEGYIWNKDATFTPAAYSL